MLKVRIIPVVLLQGYSVVKSIRFSEMRNQGNPITVARIYDTRNVDELILLDIEASRNKTTIDLFTIEDIASQCFMPLTVGGGLRSLDEISAVLAKGADKVSINSMARKNDGFIREASAMFGSQCIVVAIDAIWHESSHRVYSHLDREPTDVNVLDWAKRVEELGAGEILLNSVDRDGTMEGCDLALVRQICEAVSIPVIAVGGVSRPEDGVSLVRAGASAVGASSIFHFTSFTPESLRLELAAKGYPVRREPKIEW